MAWRIPLLLTVLLTALAAEGQPNLAEANEHRLVSLLQYVEGDYGQAVLSKNESELAEQRGFIEDAIEISKTLPALPADFSKTLSLIQQQVKLGTEPEKVRDECHQLAAQVVTQFHLSLAPRHTPDLNGAPLLWQNNCSVCHGDSGDGNTETATALTPPPANFQDAQRMRSLTPYKAYNALFFGVKGTAMASFPNLTDDERWTLAFYVFTFQAPACDHRVPSASLAELAALTNDELSAKYEKDEVACLRQRLPNVDLRRAINATIRDVETTIDQWKKGDVENARHGLIDAYLKNFEPVEPLMRAGHAELVRKIEDGFREARIAAQSQGDFVSAATALQQQLKDVANQVDSKASFWSILVTAMLILLREGFECVVIVGALLATLQKMEAKAQRKVVHVGWMSALVVGALLFILGEKLLAGAGREWIEAVVTLVAVLMLLYASMWLNSRVNTSAFMTDLRSQMKEALTGGSRSGLFFISFTAVVRETTETALFLQGLATDSQAATTYGAILGILLLALFVLVIRKIGFALPMKQMFKVSTWLLLAMAVVLLGKSLHSFQELGTLPLWPIRIPQIDLLGIFPDAVSFGAQLVLMLLIWITGRIQTQPEKKRS